MPLTPEQLKRKFRAAGITFAGWARDHGYDPNYVSRVVNGQAKAHFGKAHEIAVALGLKQAA